MSIHRAEDSFRPVDYSRAGAPVRGTVVNVSPRRQWVFWICSKTIGRVDACCAVLCKATRAGTAEDMLQDLPWQLLLREAMSSKLRGGGATQPQPLLSTGLHSAEEGNLLRSLTLYHTLSQTEWPKSYLQYFYSDQIRFYKRFSKFNLRSCTFWISLLDYHNLVWTMVVKVYTDSCLYVKDDEWSV